MTVLYYYSENNLIRLSRIGDGYSCVKNYSDWCSEWIEISWGSSRLPQTSTVLVSFIASLPHLRSLRRDYRKIN